MQLRGAAAGNAVGAGLYFVAEGDDEVLASDNASLLRTHNIYCTII